jgi:hypothetical protein
MSRVPRAVVASMTEFTHDPHMLNEYRAKLARVMERLANAPKIGGSANR